MDPDTPMDGLRQYLAFSVEARKRFYEGKNRPDTPYLCMEDFVLQEGVEFEKISPWQPQEGGINRYRPRIPRQCFDNAYKAAIASRGKLLYVEGYAHSEIFPVHHAWNIDDEGRVVDTTWCGSKNREPMGRPSVGSAYMGVVFDLHFVRQTRTSSNTSMIDRWEDGWPVLQQKYDNSYRKAVAA